MNLKVPSTVGVPEIVPPDELYVSPSGNAPPTRYQKTLADCSASVCRVNEQGVLIFIPPRSALVVIERTAFTVSVKSRVALRPPDSAWTVNAYSPAFVGVPEITPAVLKASPNGSSPPITDHETSPLFAVRVQEYAAETFALGSEAVVIIRVELTSRV